MDNLVSRHFRISRLREMLIRNDLPDVLERIDEKPISNTAKKNLMVNTLIDELGMQLVPGERRSYNTGEEKKTNIGRARTEGRTRVCKKLKKNEMNEKVKEQGEACLDRGKKIASTQSKIKKIRSVTTSLKTGLLREIARAFKVPRVNSKTKQQLVDELRAKGIRKFDPTKFV